jgi:teichuronic acid biosynthesis glycosyltransferase TuaC
MKVLLLSNLFPTSRDPVRGLFTLQLAQAMSRQGPVHAIVPLPWIGNDPISRVLFPGRTREFGGLQREMTFGDVHATYARYLLVPKISRRWHAQSMIWGIAPTVRRLHRAIGFDVINAHWLDPDGIAAAWLAHNLHIPLVLTGLGCDVNIYAHDEQRRASILDAIAASAAVTTVSEPLRQGLVDEGVPASKITVIPNGVDTERFRPRPKAECRAALGLPHDAPLIVCVSRLSDEKGVDVLVRAFAQVRAMVPGATLALVGAGPLQADIEREAAALRLGGSLRLVGAVPHEQVAMWLGAGDVSCLPSLREGHPNAAMEALASGRPLVASRVGALPGMIQPGTGRLVEPGDAVALSQALVSALGISWNDETIAASVREGSWQRAAREYQRVYDQAVRTTARIDEAVSLN